MSRRAPFAFNRKVIMPQMDNFAAAMIADGEFELAGFEPTEENVYAAYQHLVDTGLAWSLQGRVGRTARLLIEQGLIRG